MRTLLPLLLRASMMPELGTLLGLAAGVPGWPMAPATPVGRPAGW